MNLLTRVMRFFARRWVLSSLNCSEFVRLSALTAILRINVLTNSVLSERENFSSPPISCKIASIFSMYRNSELAA